MKENAIEDPEIRKIFEDASKPTSLENLELASIMTGKCRIGNTFFPAPSMGTFLLLEEWGNPLSKEEITETDFLFLLYLLVKGKNTAEELLKKRTEEHISPADSPRHPLITKTMKKDLFRFRKRYGRLFTERSVRELSAAFSLHGGFDMLPDPPDKFASGEISRTEKVIALSLNVQEFLPSLSFEDVLWHIPYSLLSYLVVCSARKRGIKGIGRDAVSRKLWEYFSRKQIKQKDEK